MDKNGNKLDELELLAAQELINFFNGPSAVKESTKALSSCKLALGSLSAISRLKATMRVKDATQIAVIQNIAENKEQFSKFAQASLPHLAPKKLITSLPPFKDESD